MNYPPPRQPKGARVLLPFKVRSCFEGDTSIIYLADGEKSIFCVPQARVGLGSCGPLSRTCRCLTSSSSFWGQLASAVALMELSNVI